jgi:L-lactate dehydrogenase complex protein LldG
VSREAILGRVRAALAGDGAGADEAAEGEGYERQGSLTLGERVELLEHRLDEYGARTVRCGPGEIAGTVAVLLTGGGKRRVATPAGVPREWLAEGVEWVLDDGLSNDGLSNEELNGVDGVLTGASAAVAISGSIVLQHGPAEGRRVITLLPDYHLCVLFAEQVVETLPEAFARMGDGGGRPITFISGPSATADIEMTRIKGVHGPRFLDVILVWE